MRSYSHHGATAGRATSSLFSLAAAAAAGLTLLAPGTTRADYSAPVYHSAPLLASGDRFGTAQIPAGDDLFVGGLTDAGQIIFSAGKASGSGPDLLLQWAGGKLTPIVTPPTGPASASTGPIFWPHDVTIDRPVSVNEHGRAVFSVSHSYGTAWGTFLWDAGSEQLTTVALKGMPATGNSIFAQAGGFAPAISNTNEIALVGQVKEPTGLSGYGLFSLGTDRVLRPVVLPGQMLPVGVSGHVKAITDEFFLPSIDNAGRIAFLAHSQASARRSVYIGAWGDDYREIEPLLAVGTAVPGGGKITDTSSVSLNSRDGSALVTATTDQADYNHWGLYRVQGQKITKVAAPGTYMPGGGKLKTIQHAWINEEAAPPIMAVSEANAAGQHAFLATLEDGTAGAYAVDRAGRLSLVFKATAEPKPVHITEIGYSMTFVPSSRPCLNNRGQIALSVRIQGGPSMIVLLTPIGS